MTIQDAITAFCSSLDGNKKISTKRRLIDVFGNIVESLEVDLIDLQSRWDKTLIPLHDYIGEYSQDKGNLVELIKKFLFFVNQQFRTAFPLESLKEYQFSNKHDRMIEILKYLHEGEKSRGDIAEHLKISTRQLSEDLRELQNGYEFLGYKMKIDVNRGTNTYDSTVHPIFLSLNLTEVYALTVGLKMHADGSVFSDVFNYIADAVYDQLSGYGQSRIREKANDLNIKFAQTNRKYRRECDLINKSRSRMLAYYFKSGAKCIIEYDTPAGVQSKEGVISPLQKTNKFEPAKIEVYSASGSDIIPTENILSIKLSEQK